MATGAPPQYSADGNWWWNGNEWQAVSSVVLASSATNELDRQIADAASEPSERWGVAAAAGVLWLALVEVLFVLLSSRVHVRFSRVEAYALGVATEASIGVVAVLAAAVAGLRDIWRRVFALAGFARADFGLIIKWGAIQMVMRGAAIGLLLGLLRASPRDMVPNIPNLHYGYDAVDIAVLFFIAVLIAPLAEELLFRGLVLRAAMRRLGFIPAALVSSLLFGLAHAHEEPKLIGAVLLTATMTLFGLLQCTLVRRCGRLTPAVGVHALLNALAVAVAFL